jgi:hypothetical protein
MKQIIFHSFYTDSGFFALKQALFYFGKLLIPADNFFAGLPTSLKTGDNGSSSGGFIWGDIINLVPEHVVPHLKFLEQENLIEFVKLPFDQQETDPRKLFELFAAEAEEGSAALQFSPADFSSVYSFLGLNPEHPASKYLVDQLAVMIVIFCLRGVASGKGIPCVDNPLIFDLMNIGLKGIFNSFADAGEFTREDAAQLKAQYLAQTLMSIYLPSFSFRTFEEVLELREEFSEGIAALQSKLLQMAKSLEGLPWEGRFQNALSKEITQSVIPEINALRKAARFSPSRIAREMFTAGVVISLQSFLPDLLADWVVGAQAYSLKEAILKEKERTREVYLENSFSLLLQVPR